ncbi:MAG TPA: peptidase E [Cytophagales bacterium]|nr:peptidase E [Cytophagales bacterium]HAA18577.1 peptidase E [Cytophagales bacterium]HAP63118.1 peptidase E [Cytophagales bacterium]
MKHLLLAITLALSSASFAQTESPDKTLFVYGGQVTREFIQYTADLTGKEKPKICFLPTANGDNPYYINYWYELCAGLEVVPSVMEVWINSPYQSQSWEEILTSVDAIIVGGGNTLNMLAIWQAQEIDQALEKAYEKGIVLAGGSAGSLCWFEGGTTDSRPQELSIVEGLAYLPYSHCPHYTSEESRRPLYHENILSGALSPGYACDDRAGLVFVNDRLSHGMTLDENQHSYFVTVKDGEIVEEEIEAKVME